MFQNLPLVVAAVAVAAPAALAGSGQAAPPVACRFTDVTEASGLRFRHVAGRTPDKQLPETMGAGLALLDFDGDGDLDVYLVQGRPAASDEPAPNELWRNDTPRGGALRFSRVPGAAGAADPGLGQGACVGDVDSDGDPDLLVTNVGPDALYRNRGDGTFERQEPGPGLGDDLWSASCTFVDVDSDADLDLYVTRYVDWHPTRKNPYCGDAPAGVRAYCHPDAYHGVPDALLLNDGRGGFTEAPAEALLSRSDGNGLGVTVADPDGDGDLDILVANDASANFLWINDGQGRFRDRGLVAGFAYNEEGRAESGMGVVAGDVDGDWDDDAFLTHLDLQTNTLYRGDGKGRFRDATIAAGLAEPSLGLVGFGTELADFDLDSDLDLYVVNGHIIDNIEHFNSALSFAQPDQLLLNDGEGRFRLATDAGDVGRRALVGRGAAAGDLDGDGDLDLVVTENDGPAHVYRNDGAERRSLVVLELQGTRSTRDALGALVLLRPAGRSAGAAAATGAGPIPPAPGGPEDAGAPAPEPAPEAAPEAAPEPAPEPVSLRVQGARSYLSNGTRRLHAACPTGGADVTVRWPSGSTETFAALACGRGHLLVEGAAGRPTPALAGAPGAP